MHLGYFDTGPQATAAQTEWIPVRDVRPQKTSSRPRLISGRPGRGSRFAAWKTESYVASIFSRTVRLAARSSLIFDGSLPPASAKSGRPPPPPPTIGASSFTIWPAGAFLTRSGVTPTTIETLPSEGDARTTTPLLILL